MRPDKHKKRQHAAYARKAGKKESRNARASPETNAGRTRPSNSSGHDHMEKEQTNLVTGSKLNSHGGFEDVLSSEKKLTTSESVPSFSRRKIESNWEQYEESVESDESVDKRGADFTFLLNQTVGSNFRFKDEDSFDDNSIQVDIASLLSFNCVELAQKLQSIALPERLEISRSVFDVESLEILDQDAVTSATMGQSQDSQRLQNVDKSITSTENLGDNYLDQELDDILTLTEKSGTLSGAPNKLESHSSQREFPEETSSELTCTSDEVKIHSSKDGYQAEHLKCSEEDELDFLLSLDAPAIDTKNKNKDEPSVKGENRNPSPTTENLPKCEKSVPMDSAAPSVSSSEIATENLDDWLDSILDD